MEDVLSTFMVQVPRAAAIWIVLLVVAAIAFAGLLFDRGRDWVKAVRRAALPDVVEESAAVRELRRYAQEVAVAADRAAITARRRRTEWLTAQERLEAAWRAFDDAEATVRRLAAASALPAPRTPRTPAEYAERERYLHRAALEAYWRRELSVQELSDVFAHRDGWDPRRHPVEQELHLRRRVRDNLLTGYRAAAEHERAAWQDAELAAVAARTLRDEARAAAERAERTRPQPAWAEESTVPLVALSQQPARQAAASTRLA